MFLPQTSQFNPAATWWYEPMHPFGTVSRAMVNKEVVMSSGQSRRTTCGMKLLKRDPSAMSRNQFTAISDRILNGVAVEFLLLNAFFEADDPPDPNTSYLVIATTLQHPLSRGSSHINKFELTTRTPMSVHPIGTSCMMPQNESGVVDPQLKVYGTQNLRVVDASIIPIQISAHLAITVYAIAEKAAELIL
ncbi:hypothetical protein H4Q26_012527 [Puccinia striiformis f. sp. tritici PST-130]|nr:hypothetical protein H4Q26_012527 [Puccinia striiformis f. sp. tritici PST-130]